MDLGKRFPEEGLSLCCAGAVVEMLLSVPSIMFRIRFVAVHPPVTAPRERPVRFM